jgi:N-acyl-D-aspartate/D-glutamate deacylase
MHGVYAAGLLALIAFVSLVCALVPTKGFSRSTSAAQIDKIEDLDLLIVHGKLIDGSGGKPRTTDVGIRGDRIVFVGDSRHGRPGTGIIGFKATRTIDANGLIVAPGFIDPHTHTLSDLTDEKRKANEAFLLQGVTTVLTGNDGGSVLNVGELLSKWEQQGIGTNAALFAGFGTIRGKVLGPTDAQPTAAQLEEMKQYVARAMDDGAFGMSTGLYYAPQSYSKTEEVIELAKVAAAKGGVYDTHMRDEGSYSIGLLGAIEETVRIGREAKIPVHISHIKALGPEVWGQSKPAIALMKKSRAQGVDILACQYPYDASGSSLTASLVPRWAEVGGRSELLQRIDDSKMNDRLLADMRDNLRRRGGADSLLITDFRDRKLVGKRLSDVAKDMNKPPVEAALDLIKLGNVAVASFNMNEKDIDRFMKEKLVVTCSDGSGGHPRKYGTFPKKLRTYVFDHKLISLPFMVRNSSALTAEWFRIPQRGMIREGYFADVVVFDPKTVADRSTYEQPELPAVGMNYVIVNGKIAVENSTFTGVLAGRALRKIQGH